MLKPENKEEAIKILTGQGFNLQGIVGDRHRPLRKTLNLITSSEIIDPFTNDQNDEQSIYLLLQRQQCKRLCSFHEHKVPHQNPFVFDYTLPEVVKYLVDLCYNFELTENATNSQLLGKRTHLEAYGEIILENEYDIYPEMDYVKFNRRHR